MPKGKLHRLPARNPFRYRGYYYDLHLKLYYLESRYYDAVISRFISPEPNVYSGGFDVGTSILGYNVYAYCMNNPVMYVDHTGTTADSFWETVLNDIASIVNSAIIETSEDSTTYALYDNDRFRDEDPWHEQGLVTTVSGVFKVDLSDHTVSLGSIEFDFYTGGWEYDNLDLSLFDIGHAEAALKIEQGQFKVGAFVSAWSPSIQFNVFNAFKVEVGAEVGAYGGFIGKSQNSVSLMFAQDVDLSLTISW